MVYNVLGLFSFVRFLDGFINEGFVFEGDYNWNERMFWNYLLLYMLIEIDFLFISNLSFKVL